ncbi:MAG TPA: TetR/AcrR family transcriptional regulator [Pseudonocardiaceae bacterium]|nr:TetR/AcrR family transcriptional regulator [Pseudonocardiaceae bacterium]
MTAMSAAEPRRKRVTKSQQDRMSDILRAGDEVFREIGFQDATIEHITRAAGIAKGTFYLYFTSKDHLLAALWERYVDAFVQTTEEVLGQELDWQESIDRLLGALIEHAVRHAELHRIVYSSANAKALELCKRSNQRVIELMIGFVLANVDATQADIDPELACRMIYHAADGLLDDLIARRTEIDLAHVTRCVLRMADLTLTNRAH